jgi:glycine hydroxymethyltransferase
MNAPHRDAGFFTESLESRDPEIFAAIERNSAASATRSS